MEHPEPAGTKQVETDQRNDHITEHDLKHGQTPLGDNFRRFGASSGPSFLVSKFSIGIEVTQTVLLLPPPLVTPFCQFFIPRGQILYLVLASVEVHLSRQIPSKKLHFRLSQDVRIANGDVIDSVEASLSQGVYHVFQSGRAGMEAVLVAREVVLVCVLIAPGFGSLGEISSFWEEQ